jgi:endonuclease YncB( thermonuclease family)
MKRDHVNLGLSAESVPARISAPAPDAYCPSRWVSAGEKIQTEAATMREWIVGLLLMVSGPSWAGDAIVTDGDTLILGDTYKLDGIDAPEPDQACLDEKGAIWACGIEARDRLAKLIERFCASWGRPALARPMLSIEIFRSDCSIALR